MKKICFLILLFLPSVVIAYEDILKKVDEIRAPSKDFSFEVKIIAIENGKEKVTKYHVSVKDAIKSLVKFTYPVSEKGRVLLMVGNDMWMSFPTTQKPIRISPQQRLAGDASYGDVARVVYSVDYKIINKAKEILNNQNMYKLELSAKTKNATYGKILLWVEEDTYKPYKAECYSLFDKLLKTAYYENYQKILGKDRPAELKIYSELSKDKVTVMQYSNFQLISLPDNYFQKAYLKYIK